MSDHCVQCGMTCKSTDYHPYAACLMFKATHSSDEVAANLLAVVGYGRADRDEWFKKLIEEERRKGGIRG